MGSHCATCHPKAMTFLPLPQPKLVLDLATQEGCKAELTWIACMDIRLWLAGYLAVFYYRVPVPAKMLNGTGYCNHIFYLLTYLTNIDVGKFTYLLATKPCYSLQSATKQHKWNYWKLLVNYNWISHYTIVHNVYSRTCVPHRQTAVQGSNCHTSWFQLRPNNKSTIRLLVQDSKIYYPVHPYQRTGNDRLLKPFDLIFSNIWYKFTQGHVVLTSAD